MVDIVLISSVLVITNCCGESIRCDSLTILFDIESYHRIKDEAK